MSSLKNKIQKYSIVTLFTLILFIIVALIFKQYIFNYFLNSKIESFNKHHEGYVSIQNSKLSGITTIDMSKICLSPTNNDTLIYIDSLSTSLNFWSLIVGNIKINSLSISNISTKINIKDSTDNFSFLFKNKTDTLTDTINNKKINYYKRSNIIFNALFNHIPNNINIFNLTFLYKNKKDSVIAKCTTLEYSDDILKGVFLLNDGKYKSEVRIVSKIIPDSRTVGIKILQLGKKDKRLSGLTQSYNADISFDTAFFSFIQYSASNKINLIGKSYISNLKINQTAISKTDVTFNNLNFDFNFNIGENYFELDSSTIVRINKLNFNPYIKYTVSPTKQLALIINKKHFPSQDLFDALPEGLFHTLYGIKTKGELAYNLNFFVDFSLPDSLKFNSELKKHNFSIQQFGNTNYSNINNEFEYTAFENGESVKSFLVGPSNPKFSPINQISPFLRNAILCTEDGGFYYHRGFLIESIQQSIAEDIKRKKFARGGSTLTMQLVKNVFLNRNKTISRKLEEIIIVWLIENQQLCSKDRMYEVYLNIIEWGPKIYGITEASEFYFNKKPLTLSLSESIYLASIIPKPKYFKYSFDQNGELIQSAKDFITAIANKMLNKEMITESDLQNLDTKIIISDQAKSYIIPSDSLSTFETIDFNF